MLRTLTGERRKDQDEDRGKEIKAKPAASAAIRGKSQEVLGRPNNSGPFSGQSSERCIRRGSAGRDDPANLHTERSVPAVWLHAHTELAGNKVVCVPNKLQREPGVFCWFLSPSGYVTLTLSNQGRVSPSFSVHLCARQCFFVAVSNFRCSFESIRGVQSKLLGR